MGSDDFIITGFHRRADIARRLRDAGENVESEEEIRLQLSTLAAFLEQHGLTTRSLTNSDGRVDEGFVLRSSDLTEKGVALIRRSYEKWYRRAAKNPRDVSALEKGLKQVG
jgi:hypothetical protein